MVEKSYCMLLKLSLGILTSLKTRNIYKSEIFLTKVHQLHDKLINNTVTFLMLCNIFLVIDNLITHSPFRSSSISQCHFYCLAFISFQAIYNNWIHLWFP